MEDHNFGKLEVEKAKILTVFTLITFRVRIMILVE